MNKMVSSTNSAIKSLISSLNIPILLPYYKEKNENETSTGLGLYKKDFLGVPLRKENANILAFL